MRLKYTHCGQNVEEKELSVISHCKLRAGKRSRLNNEISRVIAKMAF